MMHIRHHRMLAAIMTWLLAPLAIVAIIWLVNLQHDIRKQRHGERQWSQSPENRSVPRALPATASPNSPASTSPN